MYFLGIVCYNKLEEMTKLVSSQVVRKDNKYVVQKYMGKLYWAVNQDNQMLIKKYQVSIFLDFMSIVNYQKKVLLLNVASSVEK